MTEKEKLDAILLGLYEYKKPASPKKFLPGLSSAEESRLVQELENKNYVIVNRVSNRRYLLSLTSKGSLFVESEFLSKVYSFKEISTYPPTTEEEILLIDTLLKGLDNDPINWHYVSDILNSGIMPRPGTVEFALIKEIEEKIVQWGMVIYSGGGNLTPNGYLMLKLDSKGVLFVKSNKSVALFYNADDPKEREIASLRTVIQNLQDELREAKYSKSDTSENVHESLMQIQKIIESSIVFQKASTQAIGTTLEDLIEQMANDKPKFLSTIENIDTLSSLTEKLIWIMNKVDLP